MDRGIFLNIAGYTHKLREMPALAASCSAAAQTYRSANSWSGEATVEPYMIRSYRNRAQFLRWWFGVCGNLCLHARLWWALKELLISHVEDYSMLVSAVLMAHCSHDLFFRGLCILESIPWQLESKAVRSLVANSHGTRSVAVTDDGLGCFVVIADGPVLAQSFSFNLRVNRRSCGDFHLECMIGYIPWPPMDELRKVCRPGVLETPGSLFYEIDEEEDLVDQTADFQLWMSADGLLHLHNLSLEHEVSTGTPGRCPPSPTGEYTVYFSTNCSSSVITCIS